MFCVFLAIGGLAELSKAEKIWNHLHLTQKDWKTVSFHFDTRPSRLVPLLELISKAIQTIIPDFKTQLKTAIKVFSDEKEDYWKCLDRRTFIDVVNFVTSEQCSWTVSSKAAFLSSVQTICRKQNGKVSIT